MDSALTLTNARLDWLVLFLAAPSGPYPTDQFRVMKGMFLLSQTTGHPTAALYRFKPYDYGPVDPGLDRDLDTLRLADLLRVQQQETLPRRIYELTEQGRARGAELAGNISEDQLIAVRNAKKLATSLDAETLLDRLYAAHPEYLVEYGWTEGTITGDEDGTILVGVYERAPAPRKTSFIAIDRISGNVTVKTDLGRHLGLPELRIPVGDRAWGPARPVIAGAEHLIEIVAAYGPDSPEVAALGPVFVGSVVRALAIRDAYPPSGLDRMAARTVTPATAVEAEGMLTGPRTGSLGRP